MNRFATFVPILAVAALTGAPARHLTSVADVRTQSSSLIPSTAKSGFALAEASGKPIHTVAFDRSNEFVILAGSRPLFSPGFPADARSAIDAFLRNRKAVDVVAFSRSGQWIVIAGNAYQHSNLPLSAQRRIGPLLSSGRRIDSFAFSQVDTNGWVLTSGGQAFSGGRLPGGMEEAIAAAEDAGRSIHEIAMSMQDHWVLVADDWFATGGVGADLRNAMDGFRANDRRRIDHVAFNLDGGRVGWAIISNSVFAPGTDAMSRIENGFSNGSRNIHWVLNKYNIRGLSIAVVENDQIAWRRNYGLRTRAGESFVFPNSIFEAASISKPISAVAALQLVDAGIVRLHDTSIITEIADGVVGSSQKQAFLDQFADEDEINLNLLLSHCAGVEHQSGGSGVQAMPLGSTLPTTLDILLGTNGALPSFKPVQRSSLKPGAMYSYSGANYALVQAAIERYSPSGFDRHMRDLLKSLDMTSSTFATPAQWRSDRFARGHGPSGQNDVFQYPNMAAASISTTADDIARFAIMLNGRGSYEGRRILRRGLILALAGQQRGANQQCANRSAGTRGEMGLGLNANGTGTWSHGGSHNGYRSFMFARPDDRWGLVVLVTGGNTSDFAMELFRVVETVYGLPDKTLSL